ncbi:Chromatin assembly factor 1 subunit [Sporothrix stenoceras]|uniref:Chromatin assembly factor 1 subunit n=1 Tax=Sporothrix stenoceras TaxID=5173 RepID=A0ABR3Z952_9PEZI
MKSTPLIINWHDQNAPIYSAHFEPHGKGRLATAGGDNNVRLWKVETDGESRKVEYLSTLVKHTQAVNVVRWSPRGELLASAGDDGNVILWVPSETHHPTFGNDGIEDKESWRTKHMCRSSGAEIYDLAWSPDGMYFIIGSMDNIARIYNAATGSLVRQVAEHSHYVQGVAWDPLNEYIATQSSDRSVHIYSLKTKDGQYTLNGLDDKTPKVASHTKADLPPRHLASQSPAPSDITTSHRSQLAAIDAVGMSTGPTSMSSPVPSAPGTPTSFALPMNPPSVVSHSRRSSFSSRRSVSPAPSMPLPAVMPMEASPKPHVTATSVAMRNASLYANETLTSFFRRLTFTPDGSLLLTPAGQYQTQHQAEGASKPTYEITNTVYIYSRGGINKAPIAHLPGHKKPSVAVRCSPIIYTLRQSTAPPTKHITIDTSSSEDPIPSLPEPITKPTSAASTPSVMDPPPPPRSTANDSQSSDTAAPTAAAATGASSSGTTAATAATPGPKSAFALSHRMIYAVATQDSVLLYDTQQQSPICVVSNLHCATFTDLAWSSDGLTLLISSSDGFCSTLSFTPGELGTQYTGDLTLLSVQKREERSSTSAQSTPIPTPTSVFAPPSPYTGSGSGPHHHQHRNSAGSFSAPSPPPTASFVSSNRPSSPARSNSTSSIVTQPGTVVPIPSASTTNTGAGGPGSIINNPPLVVGTVPSLAAASPSNNSMIAGLANLKAPAATPSGASGTTATPPETPRNRANSAASSVAGSVGGSVAGSVVGVPNAVSAVPASSASASGSGTGSGTKRDASTIATSSSDIEGKEEPPKKRRIAPTLVSGLGGSSGEGSS